jgi:peptidyl-prolyl cis-trans isomerase B (cyclophilin B)
MSLFIQFITCFTLVCLSVNPGFSQKDTLVTKKDRKKDVLLQTSMGDLLLRLSDSTPIHRDNFLKLVKGKFYDGVLFHRVINQFMIQGGDGRTRDSMTFRPMIKEANYTLPSEIRTTFFHKKGSLAAARMGDSVNPKKESSGSQFYIVQGKVFTDAGLDSVETFRLNARKLPTEHREVYKTLGGAPHLDQGYTIFGQLINGMEILDKIAAVPTKKVNGVNKPVQDVTIAKASLIKRKRKS